MTVAATFGDDGSGGVGKEQHEGAMKVGRAFFERNLPKFSKKFLSVFGIGRVVATVAGGPYPGGAIERINAETAVVGENRVMSVGLQKEGAGLEGGVFGKVGTGFFDIRHPSENIGIADRTFARWAKAVELGDLVPVVGSEVNRDHCEWGRKFEIPLQKGFGISFYWQCPFC